MDLKILLLEDNAFDANLIERFLEKKKIKFTSKRVDEKDEYEDALEKFKPDVILSDHSLSDFDSLAAFDIAKKLRPKAPFIVLTGNTSEEFATSCMRTGVDDFVSKGDLSRLPLAIKGSLDKKRLEIEIETVRDLKREIESRNEEIKTMNQEKDRFLSIISHEMLNHIASMKMGLRLLEKAANGLNEKHWSYIKRLSSSTNNMHKVLGDFMTVSRIQRGIMKPAVTLVHYGSVVQEVVERHRDAAEHKNIEVHFTDHCGNSCFRTDMGYLIIITENLLSNAVKYTKPGKRIYVKIWKEKGHYKLEVKDEGLGIPQGDMTRLYQRFEKLTPRPTGGEHSNGLGLSIVKDLCDALNATIECSSKVGAGTTFTITF